MTDAIDYDLFARIADLGSISAAGRALGISAPMASKRLARLEERLGTRLINRSTRRIELTKAGQRFRDDVVAIIDAIRTAEENIMGEAQLLSGPIRIAAPTSFGRLHIAPHLGPFLAMHPKVDLELNLSDQFTDLLSDDVDLAIRSASAVPTTLCSHILAPNHRILCAAPAYLAAHTAPAKLKDLHQHRLLAARGQSPWRLSGPDGAVPLDVRSYVGTNSSEVVRELALAGLGIALRSLWDISEDLAAGRLVRVMGAYQGLADVHIHAVHLRGPTQPRRVMAFIDYLRQLYHPTPPWAA